MSRHKGITQDEAVLERWRIAMEEPWRHEQGETLSVRTRIRAGIALQCTAVPPAAQPAPPPAPTPSAT